MPAAIDSDGYVVTPAAYPAHTKTATVTINGLETTATAISFADKVLITVTQQGRLAHWVHVPLDITATDASVTSNSYLERDEEDPNSDLLPMHQLTATTILGGTIPELDTLGQTLATQVASAIKQRDERESRMVVLGMGLDKSMVGRGAFSELVGLVLGII
ncbi:hypothetical protein COCC4DRAFT_134469 [Bipolaris maydis ATCC 48331]|uniref:Uncharacterized protein n=2 Tax=Cochliobolus heterostrophus TaxID=5016 RepID=M2TMA4_COCH5|nr:uncharacterized protein COCC4DRAFT_134469 [Bipolaris maydis ATCC 48331]EMD87664.1 hypothetical protein COCHEDRAFT_1145565 [Bipolaris maydis C5]KAH7555023.1 hypothetical protein BM1_07684 [Bipolaris maydis]ENI06863.1 hypothetical protein COCC4DRAFT_134469 [Bipolaris maydis ATCC 48331]KAJ5023076.1 hypothetical protein J3E73DRAFT_384476 [Bipolaris maydis]KAJ5056178.1 hypothetical protein J3E74DRAFT_378433 [Bipolaris maydis]